MNLDLRPKRSFQHLDGQKIHGLSLLCIVDTRTARSDDTKFDAVSVRAIRNKVYDESLLRTMSKVMSSNKSMNGNNEAATTTFVFWAIVCFVQGYKKFLFPIFLNMENIHFSFEPL